MALHSPFATVIWDYINRGMPFMLEGSLKPDEVYAITAFLLYKNGVIEETGLAAAVLNHPGNGIAWLANKIAPYDEQLEAGDIVLAGSFTRPTGAARGDVFHVDYGRLGSIAFRFVSMAASRSERLPRWSNRESSALPRLFSMLGLSG